MEVGEISEEALKKLMTEGAAANYAVYNLYIAIILCICAVCTLLITIIVLYLKSRRDTAKNIELSISKSITKCASTREQLRIERETSSDKNIELVEERIKGNYRLLETEMDSIRAKNATFDMLLNNPADGLHHRMTALETTNKNCKFCND